MNIYSLFSILTLFFSTLGTFGQQKYYIHTVAFYNFENLFDTINNPNTADDDWTPKGKQHWTFDKYQKKLENLARVLSEIGTSKNPQSPTFIGGCEIENRSVLEDLVKQSPLIDKSYGIIHFDSPDRRGIDVALLYQKKHFQPISSASIPLYIFREDTKLSSEEKTAGLFEANPKTKRIYTRNPLLVSGFLDGEEIHLIVNHWPSRLGGEKKSSPLREEAGKLNRKIIDSLQQINPAAKIIIMGDFNDSPNNTSIKTILETKAKKDEVPILGIYNPFESKVDKGMGTIAYRDVWNIFDQILVSESLLKSDTTSFQYWKSGIYNKLFLTQSEGRFKGYPLRHSATEIGFSDHFPVYIYLIKKRGDNQ